MPFRGDLPHSASAAKPRRPHSRFAHGDRVGGPGAGDAQHRTTASDRRDRRLRSWSVLTISGLCSQPDQVTFRVSVSVYPESIAKGLKGSHMKNTDGLSQSVDIYRERDIWERQRPCKFSHIGQTHLLSEFYKSAPKSFPTLRMGQRIHGLSPGIPRERGRLRRELPGGIRAVLQARAAGANHG